MKKNKILIVEDDADFCQELAEALCDEGYCVETAADGMRGIQKLSASSYDIVILDYKMPNLGGIDVIKYMKKKGLRPHLFVVSGRPFLEKRLKEEDLLGLVTGVINKPFCVQGLLENLKGLQ